MKTIILTTDFSDSARNAIDYAIAMFSYEEVRYVLLNVYGEPHSSTELLVSITHLLEQQAKRTLNKEYNYLKKKVPHELFNMEQRSECGDLSEVINSIVETENIDYLVIGTQGASGVKKTMVGSNTAQVVKHVNCTVLVVPHKASYRPPLRIGFATDYGNLDQDYTLDPLVQLAKQYQSELFIFNIRPKKQLINANEAAKGLRLHHLLDTISHDFYDLEDEDVINGIHHFTNEHEIDFLTVIAREHRFYDRLFHESISEQVSMLTTIPLLVLHKKLKSKKHFDGLHHILVPTDFTSKGDNALKYARSLVDKCKGKLFLQHVYDIPYMAPSVEYNLESETTMKTVVNVRQSAKKSLKQLIDKQHLSDLDHEYLLREGVVSEEIQETIIKSAIQIVVMGNKDANLGGDFFMSGTVKSVMQHAACPVLIVPESSIFVEPDTIVYATDLQYDESFQINYLSYFAQLYDAEFTILHIDKQTSSKKDSIIRLKELIKKTEYTKVDYKELITDDVSKGISNYLDNHKTQLLSMTTHSTNLFNKLFHKSLAKKQLRHTKIPMLVFNQR